MAKQYTYKDDNEPMMVNEEMANALNFIDSIAVPGGQDIPLSEDSIASLLIMTPEEALTQLKSEL